MDQERRRIKLNALEEAINRVSSRASADAEPGGIPFQIAGATANFKVSAASGADFVREYLKSFATAGTDPGAAARRVSPQFEIIYESFSEGSDPLWNDPSEDVELTEVDKNTAVVVGRDFAARVEPKSNRAFVVGPRLCSDSTDAIDNPMSMLMGPRLLDSSALILHASCVEKEGSAHVFFGDSGAGKSTLAARCYESEGLKILSGDQICLKLENDQVMAHPLPTTIFEWRRGSPALCLEPRKVKTLVHLVKRGDFTFECPEPMEFLRDFLKQVIFFREFRDRSPGRDGELLDLAMKIALKAGLDRGRMSYPKGVSFWRFLEENVGKPEALK